jgi:hypothetical protein
MVDLPGRLCVLRFRLDSWLTATARMERCPWLATRGPVLKKVQKHATGTRIDSKFPSEAEFQLRERVIQCPG